MDVFLYVFSLFCRAGDRSKNPSVFNGVLGFALFLLPFSFAVVRLFNSYVFNLKSALATCCSFGPVNGRNPFSSGAVLMTYVAMPLTIILILPMALNAKSIIGRVVATYRLYEPAWWLMVVTFGLLMLGPMGAGASELWVWVIFSIYVSLYFIGSLGLRLARIHR